MLSCGTVIHCPLNGIDLTIVNSTVPDGMQQNASRRIDDFPETAKLVSSALATI